MDGDGISDVAAPEPPLRTEPDAPRQRLVGVTWDRWLPWLVGAAAGLVVVGPGLAPGGLFRLDLVVPDQVPVPRGVWGLGPELPRRVPTWLPMAWLGSVVGAPMVTKAVIVACIAMAVAGAWRLAAVGGRWAGAGAGLLYGTSPFLLTRIGIGHLMVVVTMAVLPWALDDLLHPDRSVRRTFLWAAALAMGGFYGGTVAVVVVGIGCVAARGRRLLAVAGAVVAAQTPWLGPSLVAQLAGGGGSEISAASAFPTQAEGLWGLGHVLAGHGFWQPPLQVGWPDLYDVTGPVGWPVSVVGGLVLVLAILGTSALPAGLGRRAAVAGAVGYGLAVVGTLPVVDDLWTDVTATVLGAPFREAQRFLLLYLVWAAPAAALGAVRTAAWLERRDGALAGAGAALLTVLPVGVALVLAGPGLWGVAGALEPRDLPSEWDLARRAIHESPGPVVALPWELYLDVPFEGGERARLLNPLPLYLGGDVVTSSDPRLGAATQERADPREAALDDLTYDLRSDVSGDEHPPRFGAGVADLGFRWIVLVDGADASRYATLAEDPMLEQVLDGVTVDLWQVRDWPGAVTVGGIDGTERVDASPWLEPFLVLDGSGAATWRRPAAWGWLRGWSAAGATEEGLVALPAGRGPVWYWPSVVVVLADLLWLAAVVWGCTLGRSGQPRRRAGGRGDGAGTRRHRPSAR